MLSIPRFAFAALLTLAALAGGSHAEAQYFYLDADGDGANNGAEWAPSCDTTTVDVYVVTDRNQDGSPAACGSAEGLPDLYYYSLHLLGPESPFTVESLENQIPGMIPTFEPFINDFGVTVGFSAERTPLPPGTHRLLRLKVVFTGPYCRSMWIAPSSCYSLPGITTGVGIFCRESGTELVLPANGPGFGYCTDPPNRRPSVTAPAEVIGVEGDPISFPVSVSDPECGAFYLFSFYTSGVPQGAIVTGLGAFTFGKATATFSWTPAVGQAGDYNVLFIAHDPDTWNWWIPTDVADTTHITIAPAVTTSANGAPTARAGGPYAGVADTPIEFHGATSSDPNGGALHYEWAFGDGASEVGPTPSHRFASEGVYDVTLTVTDEDGLTSRDRTTAAVSARPSAGTPQVASIMPNPTTSNSEIEFTTTRVGSVSMRLFDSRGRLVGRPFEAAALGVGRHRLPVFGASATTALPAGVYFLKLVTEHDGTQTRRVTLLR